MFPFRIRKSTCSSTLHHSSFWCSHVLVWCDAAAVSDALGCPRAIPFGEHGLLTPERDVLAQMFCQVGSVRYDSCATARNVKQTEDVDALDRDLYGILRSWHMRPSRVVVRGTYSRGGGVPVLMSCTTVIVLPWTLGSLQCRDRAPSGLCTCNPMCIFAIPFVCFIFSLLGIPPVCTVVVHGVIRRVAPMIFSSMVTRFPVRYM